MATLARPGGPDLASCAGSDEKRAGRGRDGPETGKAAPLGIDIGPDGNFYVTDNQSFYDKNNKSRLLRVIMDNGKALRCEILVTGFVESNATDETVKLLAMVFTE